MPIGDWSKEQRKAILRPIFIVAISGITNGLGMIVQYALLALIVQAII